MSEEKKTLLTTTEWHAMYIFCKLLILYNLKCGRDSNYKLCDTWFLLSGSILHKVSTNIVSTSFF